MILEASGLTYILSNNIYYTDNFDLFNRIFKSASDIFPKSIRQINVSSNKNIFFDKKDRLRSDILLSKSFSLRKKIIFITDDSNIFLEEKTRTIFDQMYGSPIVILTSKKIDNISELNYAKLIEPAVRVDNTETKKTRLSFSRKNKTHVKKHLSARTIRSFLMPFIFGIAAISLFYSYGYLDVNSNIDAVYQFIGNTANQSDNKYLHAYLDTAEPLLITGDGGANDIMRRAAGTNSFNPYYYESRSKFRDVKYVPLYIEAISRNNEPISLIFENGKIIDDISLISSGTDLGYCSPDNMNESSLSYNVFNRISLKRVYHIENDMHKNNSKTVFLPQQLIERVKSSDESIESFVNQYVTIKIGEFEEQYIIANLLVDDYGHTPIFNDFIGDFVYMNLSNLANVLHGRICFDPCSSYVNSESLVETSIIPYFKENDTFVGYTYKNETSLEINEFEKLGELYNKRIFDPNADAIILTTLFILGLLSFIIFLILFLRFIKRIDIKHILLYLALLLISVFLPLLFIDFILSITQIALSHSLLSYFLYNSSGGLISFVACALGFILCLAISCFIFGNSPLNKKHLIYGRKVIKNDIEI